MFFFCFLTYFKPAQIDTKPPQKQHNKFYQTQNQNTTISLVLQQVNILNTIVHLYYKVILPYFMVYLRIGVILLNFCTKRH